MNSRQLAFCSLMTALAVTILILGGMLGIGTFAAPILAFAVLLPILEEYGAKAAITAYAASALLSFLLVSDLELSLVFAGFGWYPLMRPQIARIRSAILRFLIRLLICNSVLLVIYGIFMRILGISEDLAENTIGATFFLLFMANLLFLLLDPLLSKLTFLWKQRFRGRFFH